jgi:hypothetical protein
MNHDWLPPNASGDRVCRYCACLHIGPNENEACPELQRRADAQGAKPESDVLVAKLDRIAAELTELDAAQESGDVPVAQQVNALRRQLMAIIQALLGEK